jgi:hypothetical protein
MMIPTAMSTTFPFIANSLNSEMKLICAPSSWTEWIDAPPISSHTVSYLCEQRKPTIMSQLHILDDSLFPFDHGHTQLHSLVRSSGTKRKSQTSRREASIALRPAHPRA